MNRRVELSCVICLLNEKLSYTAHPVPVSPTKNIDFSDFMNVIFEQEFKKIRSARYDINCGLPEKKQVECSEKFDKIYETFKEQGWVV